MSSLGKKLKEGGHGDRTETRPYVLRTGDNSQISPTLCRGSVLDLRGRPVTDKLATFPIYIPGRV